MLLKSAGLLELPLSCCYRKKLRHSLSASFFACSTTSYTITFSSPFLPSFRILVTGTFVPCIFWLPVSPGSKQSLVHIGHNILLVSIMRKINNVVNKQIKVTWFHWPSGDSKDHLQFRKLRTDKFDWEGRHAECFCSDSGILSFHMVFETRWVWITWSWRTFPGFYSHILTARNCRSCYLTFSLRKRK